MASNTVSRSPLRTFFCCTTLLVTCAAQLLGHAKGYETSSVTQTIPSGCPNAFFNFGDSLSDTGNLVLAEPLFAESENAPYGSTFFERATGRFSDGRLVIDFILLAFNLPLLKAYLLPIVVSDKHGLNFAYGGGTATNCFSMPYFLGFQVEQFVRHKTLALEPQQTDVALNKVNFSTALYTICIGGNDVMTAILREGWSSEDIIRHFVPLIVEDIVSAVQTLYQQDATKFLIFNGPPEGCATFLLVELEKFGLPKDSLGCITTVNDINQALNADLFEAVKKLRASLPNVDITYFDYYSANVEILTNPSKYGFNPGMKLTACCGSGRPGTLHFNQSEMCGRNGFEVCDDPEQYIQWDGIHFTDTFYRQIAKFVLNGDFSDPPTNLTDACNLSFDNFGTTTFEEVFPGSSFLQ